MRRFVLFVAGLFVGFVGGAGGLAYVQSQAKATSDEIMLAQKMYYESADFIAMSGTLTGQGLGYPNNSYAFTCWSDRKECYVSSFEQIGQNQIGRLDGPYSYPVVKWTASQVVAQTEPSAVACNRITITIDRRSKAMLWVEEPINQTQPMCRDAETKVRKYSLEDSPGWTKLNEAVNRSKR